MAKTTTPKAAIHTEPQTSFGSQQAMENARDWTKEKYDAKNQENGHHYDHSRKHLNFAVGKDGIKSLDAVSHKDMMTKYEARLNELQYVAYKAGATNQPNSYMDWVFSGDHDVMNKMAFGDQEIDWDHKHADNSHIRRMPEVEAWAKDLYDFVCAKFGEKNVFGVEVHLDETTVHAHVNMIPVALRQTRGRAAAMYQSVEDPELVLSSADWKKLNSAKRKLFVKMEAAERGSKECVSYSGFMGETKGARGKYLRQFHTDYHEQVGKKYGLARGDYRESLSYEEQLERRHKTADQLEADRAAQELQERLDALKRKENENKETIKKQEAKIQENNTTIEIQAKKIQEMQQSTGKGAKILSWMGVSDTAYTKGVSDGIKEAKEKIFKATGLKVDEKDYVEKISPEQFGEEIKLILEQNKKDIENAETNVKEKISEEVTRGAMTALMKAANVNWGKDKDGNPYIPTPEQVGQRFAEYRDDAKKLPEVKKKLDDAEARERDLKKTLWNIMYKMLPAPLYNCLLAIDRHIHSAASCLSLPFRIIDNLLEVFNGLNEKEREETAEGMIGMEKLLLGDWKEGQDKLDSMSRGIKDVANNPDKYGQNQEYSRGRSH